MAVPPCHQPSLTVGCWCAAGARRSGQRDHLDTWHGSPAKAYGPKDCAAGGTCPSMSLNLSCAPLATLRALMQGLLLFAGQGPQAVATTCAMRQVVARLHASAAR